MNPAYTPPILPVQQEMKTREREKEYLKAKAFNMRVGRNSLLLGGRLHLLDLHLVPHARFSLSLSLALARVLSLSPSPASSQPPRSNRHLHTHGKTNKQNKSRAPQTLIWKWYVNRKMRSQPGLWATRLDDEPPSTQIIASPVLYLALAELLWRSRPCGNQSVTGMMVSFLLLARGSVLACFVFYPSTQLRDLILL